MLTPQEIDEWRATANQTHGTPEWDATDKVWRWSKSGEPVSKNGIGPPVDISDARITAFLRVAGVTDEAGNAYLNLPLFYGHQKTGMDLYKVWLDRMRWIAGVNATLQRTGVSIGIADNGDLVRTDESLEDFGYWLNTIGARIAGHQEYLTALAWVRAGIPGL